MCFKALKISHKVKRTEIPDIDLNESELGYRDQSICLIKAQLRADLFAKNTLTLKTVFGLSP